MILDLEDKGKYYNWDNLTYKQIYVIWYKLVGQYAH